MAEPPFTEQEISAAAHAWCGQMERETFYDDILYFKNNWSALNGMRAFTEKYISDLRNAGRERLRQVKEADHAEV